MKSIEVEKYRTSCSIRWCWC